MLASSLFRGASRLGLATVNRNMSIVPAYASYNNLNITQPSEYVYNLELNRPKKMNALSMEMWGEIGDFFDKVGEDTDCRVVVMSAAGKMFTSGIDLVDLGDMASIVYSEDDIARKCTMIYHKIRRLQKQFSTLEKCPKPIIGAIHSACIGGGVDLICGTDIRVCSADAWFQVKEVDMGLAADVGTLQRLPRIIGSQSLVNELCLTARKLEAAEAEKVGLVSKVYASREEMMSGVLEMAASIASKSPVAVQGTKMNLVYSRDHSPDEGLDYIARFNMAMLQSEDVMKSAMANMDKTAPPPLFAKL
eukprot:TRINITY_DN1663_c0_g2_i1.p1 TRINITY_DN1663_c0_g2~~TRINITY_DN1663_c0_g2_i1.p1  ORF type:complete len:305 (+),score=85.28 TRINITY_DN1663_c0_g2_i1:45-959(+)